MVFEGVLDPILGWVLTMPLWLGILILSFIITVIITVVYKFATDQDEMRRLKEKIKKSQADMKKHKDNPKKLQKIQQETMSVNMKYTMKSLKPTLYTMLPLFIIFAWMNANLAMAPIMPGEDFRVTVEMREPARITLTTDLDIQGDATRETVERQASWTLSGPAGEHLVRLATEDGNTVDRTVLIGEKPDRPQTAHDAPFDSVTIGYEKTTPFGDFSIFGYKPGWLFTYIIFSILFSVGLRKALRVY